MVQHRLGKVGRSASGTALLVLTLLSACAASDFGSDDSYGQSKYTPSGAFGAYLSGRYAAKRMDMEVAAEKLEQAARDGAGPEVATQAFIAALMAGRSETPRLAAALPDNPVAQLVLADRDAKAGRWADAEARFAGLGTSGITEVLRPLLVAWAQAGAKRTGVAIETLRPVYENGRYKAVMALHAGIIADIGGDKPEAARLYQLAQVEYGALNLRLGVILASWQGRSGNPEEARRIIQELTGGSGELAMARGGLDAAVTRPAIADAEDGIAEAYLAMGAALRQQNSIETAQVLLRLSLTMRPDLTAARLLLAEIQEAAKRQQAALDTLEPVSSSDPLIAVVRLRRAVLEDALGNADEATRMFERLARDYPDRAEPLTLAADSLRRRGRFGDAVALYDRAIGRLGTPSRANWLLFYERAIAHERAGQWPEAEADFQFALRLSPDQPSLLNYLGYSWTERNKNLPQARTMIQRAVELRPQEAAFIDSLGWVMLKQGDRQAALVQLERAVELMPEDAAINGHLGDALAANGRLREADFQWRRALTLKPDGAEEARIRAKLDASPAAAAPPSRAEMPGTTVR